MVRLVIDASVILKWFFDFPDEQNRDQALVLKNLHIEGKIVLIVPQYSIYEITNALTFSKYKLDKAIVLESLAALEGLKIKRIDDYSDKKLMKMAVELAFEYSMTIYDALYLALANKLKCNLVTADRKFVDKLKKHEHSVHLLDQEFLNTELADFVIERES